jgi:S-adenosylmethionine decarboxylase
LKTLGRHLIAEFYDCDSASLDDVAGVRTAMLDGAQAVGATVVGELFHKYSPQGVTGTLLIAESHLSVHTWPESGYAAVDVFTCGGLDPRPAVAVIGRHLQAERYRIQQLLRGLDDDVTEGARIGPADVLLATELGPVQTL